MDERGQGSRWAAHCATNCGDGDTTAAGKTDEGRDYRATSRLFARTFFTFDGGG